MIATFINNKRINPLMLGKQTKCCCVCHRLFKRNELSRYGGVLGTVGGLICDDCRTDVYTYVSWRNNEIRKLHKETSKVNALQ